MTKQRILLSFRTVFPFTIVSDNLADAHKPCLYRHVPFSSVKLEFRS